MGMGETLNSVGSTNPSQIGPATYADNETKRIAYGFGFRFTENMRNEVRHALHQAVLYGIGLQQPPFPPDSERISRLERDLAGARAGMQIGNLVLEQRQAEINDLREQLQQKVGYSPLTPKGEAEFKALEKEVQRLRDQAKERVRAHEIQVDRLQGIINRQQDKITAQNSNPDTEEGRFNIERQYEREFTSTAHLMGRITGLEATLEVERMKNRSLDAAVQRHLDTIQRLEEEHREYKRTNPDLEELYRQELQKVAATKW